MKRVCEVYNGKGSYRLANGKRRKEKCVYCNGDGKYRRPVNA